MKTGLSKGAFDADIKPPVVSITNATAYAQFVEARTGAAAETLERHFSRGGGAARAIERETHALPGRRNRRRRTPRTTRSAGSGGVTALQIGLYQLASDGPFD